MWIVSAMPAIIRRAHEAVTSWSHTRKSDALEPADSHQRWQETARDLFTEKSEVRRLSRP
jgi:hypothetical protein